MKPKLSITVVTYNHEDYIASCLDSILSQKVDFSCEIIVSDDCSTDGTAAIIKSYAHHHGSVIVPLFHEKNIGAMNNFIAANMACRGDYIAHIDGDDRMLPGKLQRQVDFLDAHPECAIVCHNVRVFEDGTGRTLAHINDQYKNPTSTIDDLIMHGTFFGHCSKMFRRSAMPEEGMDPKTTCLGDWLFHIQNARKGSIGYIDEVLSEWRKSRGTLSHQNARQMLTALADMEYTLQRAKEYTSNTYAVKYGYSRLYCMYAKEHFVRKNFKECAHYLSRIGETGVYAPIYEYLLRRYFPATTARLRQIRKYLTKAC